MPSWSWFYPYHYPPMLSDMVDFFRHRWSPVAGGAPSPDAAKDFVFSFTLGKPFQPFQQLLAVLPPSSAPLLPPCYAELMTSPTSALADCFPSELVTDINDKRNDWEAVVLLPFMDEARIVAATTPLDAKLTADERARNTLLPASTVYAAAHRPRSANARTAGARRRRGEQPVRSV